MPRRACGRQHRQGAEGGRHGRVQGQVRGDVRAGGQVPRRCPHERLAPARVCRRHGQVRPVLVQVLGPYAAADAYRGGAECLNKYMMYVHCTILYMLTCRMYSFSSSYSAQVL